MKPTVTRRTFIQQAVSLPASLAAMTHGVTMGAPSNSEKLRVGLVGCGGRGTGAALDCLSADEGIEIYALGDLFPDRVDTCLKNLEEGASGRINVDHGRCYGGFDAYLNVIDSGVDVVILAEPPGFRPTHLRAAVTAGKHVFMEKPAAVDPAGIRSVIESGELADRAGLSIVAGTQYRRQQSFVEAVDRLQEGMIGEIVSASAYYLTGSLWSRPRLPGTSDVEWQCRNWLYFTWLSGDHIVEQFVHNLDVMNWLFGGAASRALGMGGRLVRVDPSYGHIYDHFSVEYEFADGVRVEAKCRQMPAAAQRVANRIVGTKGVAELHTDRTLITSHDGVALYRLGERGNNAYVQEHADLIAAIRADRPINEARQLAESTLTAIMGRESAYTGLELTQEEVRHADQDLLPSDLRFGSLAVPPVPAPGHTRLDRSPDEGWLGAR